MKLYWYNYETNFGDALNPVLIAKMLNTSVEHAMPGNCDMCAIGSILELFFVEKLGLWQKIHKHCKKEMFVWGSGFIRPETKQHYIPMRKMKVLAVRGKYTRERIRSYLKVENDIVLGDPGLLCSKLVDVRSIEKKYDLGIIPHYVDYNNKNLQNINVKNAIVIDVSQPLDKILLQIAQCKSIISSAMHGLIAADSLGIPNIRMILSDKIIGGDYKFNDYYSVFDIDNHPRVIIDESTNITNTDFIFENYKIRPEQVKQVQTNLVNALKGKICL